LAAKVAESYSAISPGARSTHKRLLCAAREIANKRTTQNVGISFRMNAASCRAGKMPA
jgi:hypothetical protein